MDDLVDRPDVRASLFTLRMAAGALMASVVVFGLVLAMVVRDAAAAGRVAHMPAASFPLVLQIVGGGELVLGFVARKLILSRPGPVSRRVFMATFVAFACFASVAIHGLVLSMLTLDWHWFVRFAAVALVAMALAWPRRGVLEQAERE